MDCINNIVGLARKETYPCWSSTNDPDWSSKNASKSAYFIDSSEYTPDLSRVKDLGNLLEECRSDSIQDALLKVRVNLSRLASMNLDAYTDEIGKPHKAQYALKGLEHPVNGFVFGPNKYYKGVEVEINRGSLRLDTTGTYIVSIDRVFPDRENVATFQITTVAGQTSYSDEVSHVLPLFHKGTKAYYAASWVRTGTEKPFNVESLCGCDDDPSWHKARYLTVSGFNIDSLDALSIDNMPLNKNTYGLHLGVELRCNALNWICDVNDSFWTLNHIGTTFAKMVQLLAIKKLNNKLLDSMGPNAYNVLNADGMQKNNYKINGIVKGLAEWLAVQISNNPMIASKTDCIHCKPQQGMKVVEIDEI